MRVVYLRPILKIAACWAFAVLPAEVSFADPLLSLDKSVQLALERDAGIKQFQAAMEAASNRSVASGQLPDPVLRFGAKNLPTDTFSLDQEAMTQLSVGVMQQFPAGDSLALQENIQALAADSWRERTALQRLQVINQTRQRWFELYYWQQAVNILQGDRELFDQLLQITHSLYSVGRKQQQDVLRAELEISLLEEKLIEAQLQLSESQALLSRWTGDAAMLMPLPETVTLLPTLPDIPKTSNLLTQKLAQHPLLQAQQQTMKQSEQAVELAKQSYKPRWGISADYGRRDGEVPMGDGRSDLFSVMVSVQLPLFTGQRQDKTVSSKRFARAAEQARYLDLLRVQTSKVLATQAKWRQLSARKKLFDESVLSQSTAQSEATLNAYQSDATDFADLMRAYLSEQRTKLTYQRLVANEQKTLAQLHFLNGADDYPESNQQATTDLRIEEATQ